jgi:hypothetical protein
LLSAKSLLTFSPTGSLRKRDNAGTWSTNNDGQKIPRWSLRDDRPKMPQSLAKVHNGILPF